MVLTYGLNTWSKLKRDPFPSGVQVSSQRHHRAESVPQVQIDLSSQLFFVQNETERIPSTVKNSALFEQQGEISTNY